MKPKLKWLAISVLIFAVGCKAATVSNSSSTGANGIGLYLPHYVGIFGDDQPTWGGMWYTKQNLSIIAHLPTQSEFFIYVCGPVDEKAGTTNNLHLIVQKIKDKSGASESREVWKAMTQNVKSKKSGDQWLEFHYLACEFTGKRADTDRYSKSDQVTTIIFTACLTPDRLPSKSIYSVAIAMIPVNVSKEEKDRLLVVLEDFLNKKITYFL